MNNYWLSWWHSNQYMGAFELHWPWWISGQGNGDRQSICAAIRADSAIDAEMIVHTSYDNEPLVLHVRFCDEQPPSWSPFCERFPRAEWMQWPER